MFQCRQTKLSQGMIHVLLYTLAVVQAMLENDNWGTAQTRSKDTPWSCECLNTTELEVECRCAGPALTKVPSTLCPNLQALTLSGMGMTTLKKHDLQPYAALQDLTLTSMKRLESIKVGTFRNSHHLRTIYISEAPALKMLPAGVFEGISSRFRSLRILRTGLEAVPDMSSFPTGTIMHMIDLESNKIREIQSNSVRVKAEQVILNYNAIESVEGWAFNGSEIAKLSLKGNRALKRLSLEAFHGLQSLIDLDLSETAITFLPTGGLEGLDILRIQDTRSLTVIPSVYSFKHLKEAWLTYSFHCCAFKFPARHDPSRHALHQAYMAKMRKYCNGELSTAEVSEYEDTGQRSKRHVPLSEYYMDPWNSLHYEDERTFGPLADDGFMAEQPIPGGEGGWQHLGTSAEHQDTNLETWHEAGVFHQTTAKPKKLKFMCGNLSTRSISVICHPEPNALNPCEDIMGYTWLRASVWVVVVTAVVGNLAVLVVLLSALDQVSVPKFLMCHLATADLCMGVYLLILAVMDVHSSGEYFNFAYDWQIGCGCQVAGFLTVFASQLSIFTLSILTLERWFAITYAIYLNKRLKLRAAAQIMTAGWVYAITMAALPLLGISSYSTTSICLPMETRDAKDVAYLISLLVVNGLAFIVICICYGQIYVSLGRDTRRGGASSGERTVAKKMALLVFTDFACWAPIAFFGLTAVAGYPLIDVTRSKILLVFFYPLNSCANPYLYAIMTAQYRKDFFVLLSRYGFCTKVAQQYKMTYSLPTTNNSNPIPLVQRTAVNGTTVVTTVTAGPRRSNHSEVFV